MRFALLTLAALWHHLNAASASDSNDGVVVIGEHSIYINPDQVATVPQNFLSLVQKKKLKASFLPVAVLNCQKTTCDDSEINSITKDYTKRDDVFNEEFAKNIYVQTKSQNAKQYARSAKGFLHGPSLDLPAGPYMLSLKTGKLHVPYRLYLDEQFAFVQGAIPAGNGSFKTFPVAIPAAGIATTVGVPSRIYYTRTKARPLNGVRVVVKDIYDIKGLSTTAGSRAFGALYPPANQTAPVVQRLIDAGAIIIGKVKTTQFAAPENARDAVDFQAPFNPRGDGYQEPGSSSSGPGVAVAAYDWVDLGLGSDTGGSVRVPAEMNGVFGNRPTHGRADLSHVVSLSPDFDTPGFLARDPELWGEAIRVTYSDLDTSFSKFPKSIMTYALPSSDAKDLTPTEAIVAHFIDKVKTFLSAQATPYNYTSHWAKSHPKGTPSDIQEYLSTTWAIVSAQQQIKNVREPFFRDYAKAHGGRTPYVNPSANGSWSWGSSLPLQINEGLANMTTFSKWFNTEVLPPSDKTCSKSLFFYIFQPAAPGWRYTPAPTIGAPGLPGVLLGLNSGFLSPMAGNPDYVIVLGDSKYHSPVTGRNESLPVAIRVMAARGCDIMLVDFIKALVTSGIVPKIKAGRELV